jgi:hypothetical protein
LFPCCTSLAAAFPFSLINLTLDIPALAISQLKLQYCKKKKKKKKKREEEEKETNPQRGLAE